MNHPELRASFLKDGQYAELRVVQTRLGPEMQCSIAGGAWTETFQNDDASRVALDRVKGDLIARGWQLWCYRCAQ